MRIGIFTLFLLLSGMLFGQKAKVGIVNRDSVMRTVPGYNAMYDSLKIYRANYEKQHAGMVDALERKYHEIDSVKGKASPTILRLMSLQAAQLEENILSFEELSERELEIDSLKLLPYSHAVELAEIKMVEKYHCAIESEYKNDNREPIYLTNEVIALVKENKAAQATKKQIGYVNKDSLLGSVYPEYAKAAAAYKRDIELLVDTVEQMEYTIQKMTRAMDSTAHKNPVPQRQKQQAEIDSLTAQFEAQITASGNRIITRDSIACAPYNQKYDNAWEEMMKSGDIFYIYDIEDAKLAWKSEEMVFINLNKEFAAKLE